MKRRIVILAERRFGPLTSKMANGIIRYLDREVVAVIDPARAGQTAQDVLGYGGGIPVYATLDESLQHNPNTMLIGISPPGGQFPSEWYSVIIKAIQNKLNVISGLHEFLSDVPEFRVLAEKYNVKLIDLRHFEHKGIIARGIARNFQSKIILTVGTHGNIGKMTATIELVRQLQRSGKSADWLATGQIGIMIKGKGIPLDTVKGDFISGAVETAVAHMDGKFEYIFVEGQGSIQHLGYSPVALGLMHGSLPDAMILCHRTDIGVSDYGVNTDDLAASLRLHEQMLEFVKPSKVIGISLNSYNLTDERARQLVEDLRIRTGLPVTDPVRFGAEPLGEAITTYFQNYKKQLNR